MASTLDNYIIIRVVGKGTYGEVHLVKSKKDKKQYVLKKMDVHNSSKRERKAAEQEAKLLSRLKHPNIVSYKDSFESDDGFLYIAMGFCEGGDLYNRLKEQKGTALEERQIVEWFVQIAMALQYMHERHILHRDLKTQNIFLTKSKIIKVGDLGIARVLDTSSDMATTLIGTPYYMSPELFSNKPYNHKSDVWALGCCVYEMTTLKHAFNAKDMNSLVYKILRGKMPAMPKQYSDELLALIKAMLNHNPDRRPSVNRILRDPYIKRNIALFLEGTKKNRRGSASSSSSRPGTAESARQVDTPDGSHANNKSSGSNLQPKPAERSKAPVVIESHLEPLHVGPDLEPICEEREPSGTGDHMAGSGGSHQSAGSGRHHSGDGQDMSPAPSAKARSRRKLLHPDPKPVIVNVSGSPNPSPSNSANLSKPEPASRGANRVIKERVPPTHYEQSKNELNRDAKQREEFLGPAKSDRSQDDLSRPYCGHGNRPKSRERELVKEKSPDSQIRSGESAPGKKSSILKNPRVVPKPRPLPPRPKSGGTPQNSEAVNRSRPGSDRESGYVSQSAAESREGEGELETPRSPKINARLRRRQQVKETPRTSRSVDVSSSHRELREAAQRPSTAGHAGRSVDSARDMVDGDPRQERSSYKKLDPKPRVIAASSVRDHSSTKDDHASNGSAPGRRQPYQRHRKQPSLGADEQNSSSSTEEEGEVPVGGAGDGKKKKREDKEMNNFICQLNATLQLNKKEESSSEEEDEVDANIEISPAGSTGFIRKPYKPVNKSPLSVQPEVPEPETEVQVPMREVEHAVVPSSASDLGPPAGNQTMTTTGRLWERITLLRKDCIRSLGVEKLKRAYDILDNYESDDLEGPLVDLLGQESYDLYSGKIWQLKFCEEAAFGLR